MPVVMTKLSAPPVNFIVICGSTLNPYEPAIQTPMPATQCRSQWYRNYMVPVANTAFWFGTMLFVLGSFISFYPGAEAGWFAVTGALVGCGFFVPSKRYRIATIAIVAICLFWTFAGYQRGLEYQEWLKTRPL
jgi:hypothetical protein